MNQENKKDAVAALHRENIVRAAAALFAQKGFDASSIDDIARESGYSRRTIYIYGKSKENLLCLAIAQELRTLCGTVCAARKKSPAFSRNTMRFAPNCLPFIAAAR